LADGAAVARIMARDHYVYMVRCSDGTLYTGWALDPEQRVRAHNAGRGARYTKTRRPVCLVYVERHISRAEAMRRERKIKRMTRAAKLGLIGQWGTSRPNGPGQSDPMMPDR